MGKGEDRLFRRLLSLYLNYLDVCVDDVADVVEVLEAFEELAHDGLDLVRLEIPRSSLVQHAQQVLALGLKGERLVVGISTVLYNRLLPRST